MGLDFETAQCGMSSNGAGGIIFDYKFEDCGTRLKISEDSNQFIYDNYITRGPNMVKGVYRSAGFIYHVRCYVDRKGHVDNDWMDNEEEEGYYHGHNRGVIQPIFGLTAEKMSAVIEDTTEFIFRMNVYQTESFQQLYSYRDFPLVVDYEEFVFIGVELMTAVENKYLFVQQCWASPTPHGSQNGTAYPIMNNGCNADEYTSLEPRLPHEDRFKTQTFKFPDEEFVYIQCDLIVCDTNNPNDSQCQSSCRNNHKKSGYHNRLAREASEKQSYHITLGPMEVASAKMGSAKQTSNYGATSSWMSASIVASVFAVGLLVNHVIKKKSKIDIISDDVNESAM
jgi:hypothetical protein